LPTTPRDAELSVPHEHRDLLFAMMAEFVRDYAQRQDAANS
jgi:hypothetical protein